MCLCERSPIQERPLYHVGGSYMVTVSEGIINGEWGTYGGTAGAVCVTTAFKLTGKSASCLKPEWQKWDKSPLPLCCYSLYSSDVPIYNWNSVTLTLGTSWAVWVSRLFSLVTLIGIVLQSLRNDQRTAAQNSYSYPSSGVNNVWGERGQIFFSLHGMGWLMQMLTTQRNSTSRNISSHWSFVVFSLLFGVNAALTVYLFK